MQDEVLLHLFEAGEICLYMLLLNDCIMQNTQNNYSYAFLEPLLNRELTLRRKTVGDFSFSPPLPPFHSTVFLFSFHYFSLSYWCTAFIYIGNQLAEDKILFILYLEHIFRVFLRLVIIIFLHLSWEVAGDLFSGSFRECFLSFSMNSGLFLSLPVPQNGDHMLALLCISVSEFVF